jgi:hypothetical protein
MALGSSLAVTSCSDSAPVNQDETDAATYIQYQYREADAGVVAPSGMGSAPRAVSHKVAVAQARDHAADAPVGARASVFDAGVVYPKLGTPVAGGFYCGNAYPFDEGYPPQAVCDPKTQYCCLYNVDDQTTEGCQPFDGGPFPTSTSCWPPRCSCYPLPYPEDCSCVDLDDAGALAVSCGSCYGSPPARRRAPRMRLCPERHNFV